VKPEQPVGGGESPGEFYSGTQDKMHSMHKGKRGKKRGGKRKGRRRGGR
jgi:hypothetical protein